MANQYQAEQRLYSLDLLRAISMVWVMISHYPISDGVRVFGWLGKNGVYAIDLFFVLSGYFISVQIFENLYLLYSKITKVTFFMC